jgi:metal-responsive CopG/Arc/MetJ family transcriptional regulator
MKNITVSVDEKLAREIRVEAAKAGMSMSKFLAEAARQKIVASGDATARNRQRDALLKVLSGPEWDVSENGRMPTAEERNARR